MRNKIIILLALILTLSLFVYGDKRSQKRIRLTEKNFYDYFEFVIVSDSSLRYSLEPDVKTRRVYYGWQLKKELLEELLEKYAHYNFETPVVVKMQGHGIQTYRIEFDEEDPDAFKVFEPISILEDFTFSPNFLFYEDSKTGEHHWGFFKGALNAGYNYADLPEPEQFTLISVNGVLRFFN